MGKSNTSKRRRRSFDSAGSGDVHRRTMRSRSAATSSSNGYTPSPRRSRLRRHYKMPRRRNSQLRSPAPRRHRRRSRSLTARSRRSQPRQGRSRKRRSASRTSESSRQSGRRRDNSALQRDRRRLGRNIRRSRSKSRSSARLHKQRRRQHSATPSRQPDQHQSTSGPTSPKQRRCEHPQDTHMPQGAGESIVNVEHNRSLSQNNTMLAQNDNSSSQITETISTNQFTSFLEVLKIYFHQRQSQNKHES